jgi:site-specific DNA-methyltransferase (adenine-specific)
MMSEHFNFIDTIIWEKPQYSPTQGDKRLNNKFEYIFQFVNGSEYELDRLSIGVPYEDKSNVGRYSDIDIHCRGNIWKVGYETIQNSMDKPHPHRFPVQLVELGIKLSGIKEGSNVLDPFAGSGTTAIACRMLDMNFYGYEISEHWYQRAVKRFEDIYGVGR